MKNKSLIVLTEGGIEFGFGHITRCLSICNIFKRYNYDITFIINGDDSIDKIMSEPYCIFNWLKNKDMLLHNIKYYTLILLDSIKITNLQLLEIEALNKPLIFIDDDKRRNILNKGFVIDWTVLSEKENYFTPKKAGVIYLLGSKYIPLREEFQKAMLNPINKKVKEIMVTFGGADVRNITPQILKNLTTAFPLIKKNIVIGSGFLNIKEIQKFTDNNTNLIYNASTKDMITLMQTNDLAIASGGQTLYELARIGTPTIAILLVDNAIDDTKGWHEIGSLVNIGWWDNSHISYKLIQTIKQLSAQDIRVAMQKKAHQFITSNGAKLLVDTILENTK